MTRCDAKNWWLLKRSKNFQFVGKLNSIQKQKSFCIIFFFVKIPRILYTFFVSVLICSVKTDLMENGANSTLFIAKVRKTDTGNYTCSIGPNDFYTINVQVLNGNSLFSPFFRYIHCFEYIGSGKLAKGFIKPFQKTFFTFFYSSYSFILSSINHYNSEISHHLSNFSVCLIVFLGVFFNIRRKPCRTIPWKCCIITNCGYLEKLAWSLYSHCNAYFESPLSSFHIKSTFGMLIGEFINFFLETSFRFVARLW